MTLATPACALTDDALLGGRLRLHQPASGYRVAIDPVLLAAAVPARAEDVVLDVGSGVGAASLCLAARVPGCRIIGIERQRELVGLAQRNIARNDLAGRVAAIAGDLLHPPSELMAGSFTQVMANPPFLEATKASPSPHAGKRAADIEGEAVLADWLDFALSMLREKGTLSLIHRADRLGDILALLSRAAGAITVFPLWPGEGKPAARILVQARKGSAAPLRLAPGLVLHRADGRNTEAAEAVLRHAAALAVAA